MFPILLKWFTYVEITHQGAGDLAQQPSARMASLSCKFNPGIKKKKKVIFLGAYTLYGSCIVIAPNLSSEETF